MGSQQIEIAETPGDDIELQVSSVSARDCNPTSIRVSLWLQNVGCVTYPEGYVLSAMINFDGQDYMIEETLTAPFPPGENEFISENIDLNDLFTGEKEVTAQLISIDDINPDNNSDNDDIRIYQEIEPGFLEDFSNFSLTENAYLELSSRNYSDFQVVQYQSNEMLGFAGTTMDPPNEPPFGFAETCPTLDRTLDDNTSYQSGINICVNSFGLDDPIVSFDMVKISHPNDLELDPMHSAVVRVETNQSIIPTEYYYDQPNGLIEKHFYRLPRNFNGDLEMTIFTVTGEPTSLQTFDSGDIVLIDNIQLSDGFVNTKDLSANQVFSVAPNPSKDVFWFENIEELSGDYEIQIFDPFGKKVGQLNNVIGRTAWSADLVAAGFYFYRITHENELVDFGKLVVQK